MSRFLLVEPNEMDRMVLSRRLEQRGHVVESVPVADVFQRALGDLPDAILLALGDAGGPGWRALAALAGDRRTSATPLIGLTAGARPDERERALAGGCAETASKPLDIDALLERMNDALAKRETAEVPPVGTEPPEPRGTCQRL